MFLLYNLIKFIENVVCHCAIGHGMMSIFTENRLVLLRIGGFFMCQNSQTHEHTAC